MRIDDALFANMSLEQKIGQLFLVGFPGTAAGFDELAAALAERPYGNVILFSRNCGSAAETRALCAALREKVAGRSGLVPLIAVDQEGGAVVRQREGLSPMPGAMTAAAACEGGGASLADLELMCQAAGGELAALGINFNLAPVADVNINPRNPVIGARSFGEDPLRVAEFCLASFRGYRRAGILSCAKHFPGHGDASVDSHLDLPIIDADRARLDQVELLPFKRLIDAGVDAVMSAHVRFPAVEPEVLPATLSSRALGSLLRGELGFQGIIVTDCLEMKAVHERYDNAPLRAFMAGADLLCISHSADLQADAFDSIRRALLDGLLPESRIDESLARIVKAKAALGLPFAATAEATAEATAALRSPESLALAEKFFRASISLMAGEGDWLSRGGSYVECLPDIASGVEDVLPGSSRGQKTMGALLGVRASERGLAIAALGLPRNPSESDIESCVARLKPGPLVLGLSSPGWSSDSHPGQRELLRRLAGLQKSRGRALSCFSMRSPYDARSILEIAGPETPVACAYEYSEGSISAAADFLIGVLPARGRCPVRAL